MRTLIGKLRTVLLMTTLAAALVACGGDSAPATGGTSGTEAADASGTTPASSAPAVEGSEAGGALTTLNVGDIKIAARTDGYAADKLGIFERHGLEVNYTYATSGQDIITALESGQLDVGLAIPGTVMVANANQFDFVGLVQVETAHAEGPDTGGLVVRADSDIQSLADLEGKSIAVNSTGANQVYVSVLEILRAAGIDAGTVQFQEIPFPQMGPVLTQGQVDAIATVDPFTTMLTSSGEGRVVSWYYVEALPEMPLGAFWAQRSWAEANPEVAEAFRAAMIEAGQHLSDNPDEARDLIAEFTGLDRAILDDMPLIQWDHEVSTDTWGRLAQMYVDAGLLDEPIAAEELLTEGAIAAGSG